MITARELREGRTVRVGGDVCRVLAVSAHAPTAQQGGVVHVTTRNLRSGHVAEHRWPPDERLAEAPVERTELRFLYADRLEVVLLHPQTFEQYTYPRTRIEHALAYLPDGALLGAWLLEGQVLDIELPKHVEVPVAATGAGVRESHGGSVMKEATLANGVSVLVPQFVQIGDTIVVDVETGAYLDRVRRRENVRSHSLQ